MHSLPLGANTIRRIAIPRISPRWRGAVVAAVLATACSDGGTMTTPNPVLNDPVEVGVVVGSVDLSLTVFEVDSPSVSRTVGLGADGSPVGVALRGSLAAVPMGIAPALVVVDLTGVPTSTSIALRPGSGATGADFANDSIVIVANPELNTVTPVNINSGGLGDDIPVGVFPQFVRTVGDRVYVLNANLVNFTPAGASSVTVLDATTFSVVATVTLSGENAQSTDIGPDGRLYVVNSGTFFGDNGTVSVIDRSTNQEVGHHVGFGDFPGSLTFGSDGNLYVSSFSFGVAAWNPASEVFVRGPDDAIDPASEGSSSGVGFDSQGRLYVLSPECQLPSSANRATAAFALELSIPVGICPLAIGFTEIDPE